MDFRRRHRYDGLTFLVIIGWYRGFGLRKENRIGFIDLGFISIGYAKRDIDRCERIEMRI
jgi:hypothetical protein